MSTDSNPATLGVSGEFSIAHAPNVQTAGPPNWNEGAMRTTEECLDALTHEFMTAHDEGRHLAIPVLVAATFGRELTPEYDAMGRFRYRGVGCEAAMVATDPITGMPQSRRGRSVIWYVYPEDNEQLAFPSISPPPPSHASSPTMGSPSPDSITRDFIANYPTDIEFSDNESIASTTDVEYYPDADIPQVYYMFATPHSPRLSALDLAEPVVIQTDSSVRSGANVLRMEEYDDLPELQPDAVIEFTFEDEVDLTSPPKEEPVDEPLAQPVADNGCDDMPDLESVSEGEIRSSSSKRRKIFFINDASPTETSIGEGSVAESTNSDYENDLRDCFNMPFPRGARLLSRFCPQDPEDRDFYENDPGCPVCEEPIINCFHATVPESASNTSTVGDDYIMHPLESANYLGFREKEADFKDAQAGYRMFSAYDIFSPWAGRLTHIEPGDSSKTALSERRSTYPTNLPPLWPYHTAAHTSAPPVVPVNDALRRPSPIKHVKKQEEDALLPPPPRSPLNLPRSATEPFPARDPFEKRFGVPSLRHITFGNANRGSIGSTDVPMFVEDKQINAEQPRQLEAPSTHAELEVRRRQFQRWLTSHLQELRGIRNQTVIAIDRLGYAIKARNWMPLSGNLRDSAYITNKPSNTQPLMPQDSASRVSYPVHPPSLPFIIAQRRAPVPLSNSLFPAPDFPSDCITLSLFPAHGRASLKLCISTPPRILPTHTRPRFLAQGRFLLPRHPPPSLPTSICPEHLLPLPDARVRPLASPRHCNTLDSLLPKPCESRMTLSENFKPTYLPTDTPSMTGTHVHLITTADDFDASKPTSPVWEYPDPDLAWNNTVLIPEPNLETGTSSDHYLHLGLSDKNTSSDFQSEDWNNIFLFGRGNSLVAYQRVDRKTHPVFRSNKGNNVFLFGHGDSLTAYKRVDRKVHPVSGTFPEEARVRRQIPHDPLLTLPHLTRQPPEFTPSLKLTQERMDQLDVNDSGYLWPEEEKLFKWIMKINEDALAFDDQDRGTLKESYFSPYIIPTVPHSPWECKNIPIPPGIRTQVIEILKQKIDAGVYEPSRQCYTSTQGLAI
ncbi:hypothetical protein PLICRDRAFT_28501 [Plicaturopsis crispa FD-325 SS-3]|nr:hypothetical protein PLICRDRAFT_28501 [Plicaturopsis crispa FD-325 SS-3]